MLGSEEVHNEEDIPMLGDVLGSESMLGLEDNMYTEDEILSVEKVLDQTEGLRSEDVLE